MEISRVSGKNTNVTPVNARAFGSESDGRMLPELVEPLKKCEPRPVGQSSEKAYLEALARIAKKKEFTPRVREKIILILGQVGKCVQNDQAMVKVAEAIERLNAAEAVNIAMLLRSFAEQIKSAEQPAKLLEPVASEAAKGPGNYVRVEQTAREILQAHPRKSAEMPQGKRYEKPMDWQFGEIKERFGDKGGVILNSLTWARKYTSDHSAKSMIEAIMQFGLSDAVKLAIIFESVARTLKKKNGKPQAAQDINDLISAAKESKDIHKVNAKARQLVGPEEFSRIEKQVNRLARGRTLQDQESNPITSHASGQSQ